MDYKELLERCRTKPGWLGTDEQKRNDAHLKYTSWVRELDKKTSEGSTTAKNKNDDFWSGKM